AVIEGGFFIVDDPRRTGARLALRRPARSARGGYIKAVVAFQSLAVVLDLTARSEGGLGLGAGGQNDASASDGQYGAHGRIRADRVPACKTGVKAVQRPRPRVARLVVLQQQRKEQRSGGLARSATPDPRPRTRPRPRSRRRARAGIRRASRSERPPRSSKPSPARA